MDRTDVKQHSSRSFSGILIEIGVRVSYRDPARSQGLGDAIPYRFKHRVADEARGVCVRCGREATLVEYPRCGQHVCLDCARQLGPDYY